MSANTKESMIINEFAKDITCLNPIYEELSDINFFEILKIDQMEIRHSNFLAWLLDPSSPSGIGDKLLKKLLMFCIGNNNKNPQAKNYLDAIKIELMDLDDVIVEREYAITKKRHLDLLLYSEENDFCICIENKIYSKQRNNQLSDYYTDVEAFAKKPTPTNQNRFIYNNRYYILLSPTGIEVEDEEDMNNWMALSYADVYDWIQELAKTYAENMPQKAKALIDDYLNALQRHVIEGEFKGKCEKIYMMHPDAFTLFETYRGKDKSETTNEDAYNLYSKHKEAIDLVLDNRTDLTEKVKLRLIEALKTKNQYVQYDPKRAPAYLKLPNGLTEDSRLVDYNRNDISKDFLYFELYYAPRIKCFYVSLKCQMDNRPAGFDSTVYGKELNKNTALKSKRVIKEKTSKYISELRRNPKEPSADEPFIQELCKEIISCMNNASTKRICQDISNAIR